MINIIFDDSVDFYCSTRVLERLALANTFFRGGHSVPRARRYGVGQIFGTRSKATIDLGSLRAIGTGTRYQLNAVPGVAQ